MPAPRELTFVKWGGSLITDKKTPQTLRKRCLARLCRELEEAIVDAGSIVLGHGSGSFGHAEAQSSGVQRGLPATGGSGLEFPLSPRPQAESALLEGIASTRWQASRLHAFVVEALHAQGLAPFSWLPSSAMVARSARPARVSSRPIELALALGLLPVTMGDVVLDEHAGVSIQSTESVLLALARSFGRTGQKVCRMIWCGESDGVLGPDGRRIDRIDAGNVKQTVSSLQGAAGIDVTGGIRHRVEAAWAFAQMGVDSLILDARKPGRFAEAVRGAPVDGTRVVA